MTKKSKTTVPEHDDHDDDKSISSQHLRKRDKFFSMFRTDKTEAQVNSLAGRRDAEIHLANSVSMKVGDNHHSSAHSSSIAVSSSEAVTRPTTETAKIRFCYTCSSKKNRKVKPNPKNLMSDPLA